MSTPENICRRLENRSNAANVIVRGVMNRAKARASDLNVPQTSQDDLEQKRVAAVIALDKWCEAAKAAMTAIGVTPQAGGNKDED